MKKATLILLVITAFLFFNCSNNKTTTDEPANVYFTSDISPEGVMRLFEYIKDNVQGDNIGIKVHFGEDGNTYFVPATMIEPLCAALNATLVETNVAYKGRRDNTETHIQLARDHGFTFAPIDILCDGGTLEVPVVGGRHFQTALLGKNLENYSTIVYFTHFKGHGGSGFGGCIKNASMGMATPLGKRLMHKNDFPQTKPKNCNDCGLCVRDCPEDAITLEPLEINLNKCSGCGMCITACPRRAIVRPADDEKTRIFLEKLVEYAKPAVELVNSVYFNIIMTVSPSCDCASNPREPFISDIGILASTDIVAIEAAAHDLVDKAHQCDDAFMSVNSVSGKHQIDYAEQLGMGTKRYKLIDIDKK
ncbi:MAG: DUF362 domain-containing protein [Bacteroidetes bacterium]|nr:DUF362 domain-containing protein [Bacteroidota bacterium]MCL2302195.1 DUF362 domain-containing protein [Lentimicrobiaceae bacterium]MCL2302275.1 DUF362 domain-containing protein [Lentimicrobiaceae bacterium]